MIRLGFAGTGWIGRNRMEAMVQVEGVEAVAICDPNAEMAIEARKIAPGASVVEAFDDLLTLGLEGIVIATPSALHAAQSIAALQAGTAVFCQKPLGRNAEEVRAVLAAARSADRMLGVDLSYRHTAAIAAVSERLRSGALGDIFSADLVFHNAYGPGAAWFWDPALSGGGCLIDLGVHLIDLALWLLDFPEVRHASAATYRNGRSVAPGEVEDYAVGTLELASGATIRIACSWNLSAGRDAIIEARFHGTRGGAEMRNEDGSFFDFSAFELCGRDAERIAAPPDLWGSRAATDWVTRLVAGERFAGTTTGLLASAEALDRMYESARRR